MCERLGFCAVFIAILSANRLFAQNPTTSSPYDGIQAGFEAFQMAEERRQANLAQQLQLNAQLPFWTGYPGFSTAVPFLPPADRDFAYAYGGRRYWSLTHSRFEGRPLNVFEPWPAVPGDIFGYTVHPSIRQPIGQLQTQTGPNRWESHPVYSPPLADFRPLPPIESPYLDRTPYASPRRGPREF